MLIRLRPAAFEQLRAEAIHGWPAEVVGLLVGVDGVVTELWPLTNHHPRPARGFIAHADEMSAAARELTATGLTVLGLYHSHVDFQAACSDADRYTRNPGELMVIVGTMAGRFWEARGYRVIDGQAQELALVVEDG